MKKKYFIVIFLVTCLINYSQSQSSVTLQGTVYHHDTPVTKATVSLLNTSHQVTSDSQGQFSIPGISPGLYSLYIHAEGFADVLQEVRLTDGSLNKVISLKRREHQLQEIIVTAEKIESSLQKTALSLSVLDAKDIENSRVWDIQDLTALVPNLYTAHPGDLRSVLSIRGVTSTSYEPAVAVYVDGVNQFSLDSYITQFNDIERIEVLRGPQGTLYGRNATGGVINIISKKPDNRPKGFVEINYGSYNLQRYAMGLQLPLIADKLYIGGSGMFSLRDGYFFNEFTNSSYDDLKLGQGNYFLKYQANKELSFLFNVKHQGHFNKGPFPLVMGSETAFQSPYKLDQNSTTTMRDKTVNVSLTATYQREHFKLSSQTSYQDNHRFYQDPIDGDFSNYDIISIINNYGKKWNRSKAFMQEVRLSSITSDSKFHWNTGVYGFIQDNPVKQGTYYGDDAGMYGLPMTNFTDIGINNLSGFGLAAFGQLNYRLSSAFSFVAGLRYDHEHKRQEIKGEMISDAGSSLVTRTDTSSSASYKSLSPKLALNYKLSDHQQIHLTYSKGFRSGGISPLSSEGPTHPPLVAYDPEYSDNIELGSKNMFAGNRLRIHGTLFYTVVRNGQIPVLIMPEAMTIIRNASKMTSKGIELELAAIPLKGMEFIYNFGYTDARYTELSIAGESENIDLSKNRQVFTPRITSLLAVQYEHSPLLKSTAKLRGRVEYRGIGKQYFDLSNTIVQEGYGLLNCSVGLQYKAMEIAAWASNLTNERYIGYAYDFGAANLGAPKTFGGTVRHRF